MNRMDEAIFMLLQHMNVDIVCAIAGIVINFTATAIGRQALLEKDSIFITQLATMLRKLSLRDITIGTLISQVSVFGALIVSFFFFLLLLLLY
jgi:hypothetical protein